MEDIQISAAASVPQQDTSSVSHSEAPSYNLPLLKQVLGRACSIGIFLTFFCGIPLTIATASLHVPDKLILAGLIFGCIMLVGMGTIMLTQSIYKSYQAVKAEKKQTISANTPLKIKT